MRHVTAQIDGDKVRVEFIPDNSRSPASVFVVSHDEALMLISALTAVVIHGASMSQCLKRKT